MKLGAVSHNITPKAQEEFSSITYRYLYGFQTPQQVPKLTDVQISYIKMAKYLCKTYTYHIVYSNLTHDLSVEIIVVLLYCLWNNEKNESLCMFSASTPVIN